MKGKLFQTMLEQAVREILGASQDPMTAKEAHRRLMVGGCDVAKQLSSFSSTSAFHQVRATLQRMANAGMVDAHKWPGPSVRFAMRARSAGIRFVGIDASGEAELALDVDGCVGRAHVSREFIRALDTQFDGKPSIDSAWDAAFGSAEFARAKVELMLDDMLRLANQAGAGTEAFTVYAAAAAAIAAIHGRKVVIRTEGG